MAKKLKASKGLRKAAQELVDGMQKQGLQRAPKDRALLEMLLADTYDEQEEDSTKSASSARNKRGSPKAGDTTYPMKPETLTIPSEKEMMEGGTYSPPPEYRVKKRVPTRKPPK
jgi:hypothetical protein